MPITKEELTLFSNSVGKLMTRGDLSFVECLTLATKQNKNKRFQRVMNEIIADVAKGYPLSMAMSLHPGYFSKEYVALIRHGERTVTLEKVLQQFSIGEEADNAQIPVEN